MKKFVTAVASFVLAGTMTFGFAACNNNGNNNSGGNTPGGLTGEQVAETLQTAIDATLALPNFTVTDSMQSLMAIKYNGEVVDAETEIGTISAGEMSMPFTGAFILNMFGMEEGEETTDDTDVYKYDFTNGKVAEYDEYRDYKNDEWVGYTKYTEVEGTAINLYGKQMDYSTYEVYNTKTEYVGYADNATAKQVLHDSYEIDFANMFNAKYTGVGENSEREGTLSELLDLFIPESDGKTYGIKLTPTNEIPIEADLKLIVEGGKLTGISAAVDGDIDLMEFLGEMGEAEGVSIALNNDTDTLAVKVKMDSTVDISAIGSTSVGTIPEEDKTVDEEHVYSQTVLSDEAIYQNMFEKVVSEEGSIGLSIESRTYDYDTHTSEWTSVTVTVNEQLNVAKVTEKYTKYVDGYREAETVATKLYWASDDGMKIYTAEYNSGNYFQGWSDAETEAISGSKNEAIIAKLPAEAQLYFNFNGKPMAEQFDQFKITNFTNLIADATVNGEKVPVRIDYVYYSDGEINFNGYYCGETLVEIRYGSYVNDNPRLPEIEQTSVSEEKWKELVTPWFNINNVTIIDTDGTTLIDIAEDGQSGKIHFLGRYGDCIYAEFAPSTEEAGRLTMTVYRTEYQYWDPDTGRNETVWAKEQFTEDSFNDLLIRGGLWNKYNYIQRVCSPYYGSSYNKTLLEIADEVTYDAMFQTYNFGYNGIAFIGDKLVWKYGGSTSFTLTNRGTTVLGEIPAEALAAE